MILKKHNKSNKNNLTILTLALVIGGVMQGVAAQDGTTAQLEEVVVTARKRAESLQDVPVAVDAFSETKN